MDFIEKWLAKMLLAFKTKNPKVWGVISIILFILSFGLGAAIPGVQAILDIFNLPPETLSVSWLVETLGLNISEQTIAKIMYVLALLVGSKGTTAFLAPEKRQEVIDASKAKVEEIETKKAVKGL